MNSMRTTLLLLSFVLSGMGQRVLGAQAPASIAPPPKADVVIVGTGISGLAAALDAGRAGANVTVIDMWSVFGGHAVMSSGLVCLVDTPVQRASHIADSPELAVRDFITHGQDANPDWVHLYARDSKREVFDWLDALGVGWSGLFPLMPGNSVQRQHVAKARGVGLVSPIYQECLRWTNIHFVWNTKVTSLLIEGGQVRGVRGVSLRSGTSNEFRATAVVLATGGFESNLEMVRQHWPTVLPGLEGGAKVLLGSGINSQGSGFEVATTGGAALTNLDHQLFYSTGLVDPRDLSGKRGLNSFNAESIWVNQQGRRFVREIAGGVPDFGGSVPAVLRQPHATYWSIFDARGRTNFFVSGSGWDDTNNVQREIFANLRMNAWVKRTDNIADLARAAGLPSDALVKSVDRWNEMIDAGEDIEWKRFDRNATNRPKAITTPPFYAVQYFPLSRKSMGGVAVDLSCRVLDRRGQPIPNLYAVGELAGVGGINGRAALEGTMLGPGLLMGRIAAREVVTQQKLGGRLFTSQSASVTRSAGVPPAPPEKPPATIVRAPESLRAWREVLRQLVAEPRPGYLHFEKAHAVVLERNFDCARCHFESSPLALTADQLDRHALIQACAICHGSVKD
ncbi:MAG: FAD-binding protein [Pedosphaera sp.]|nr:FAD-binding protein [Pedosphaera sp.]